ncbi:dehydrase and lipid transport-domain-containing protein [Jimgerdemannia flammicorona]|uniref:Dehydrase and lipid transport-domain-containing protein n=1 Tax=Jimgerdemannia flammicorona TaxID=994334 RepID=A0A433D8F0_9FUNG|nr:dehydrase and lipid transport-domain-containing protein [Jimgerdemannia flammicorona]
MLPRIHLLTAPFQPFQTLRPPYLIPLATTTRSFFSLPPLPTGLPNPFADSSKKEYSERKLLNYSQQQLYDVVSDVDQYNLFVPWCTHSRVLSTKTVPRKDKNHAVVTVMKAELGVGFKGFSEQYVSEVTCNRPWRVRAISTDSSLFRTLVTTWRFTPTTPHFTSLTASRALQPPSCYIDFGIIFEFASPLHVQVANLFFDQISKDMIRAFEQRCEKVYGKGEFKAK